MTHYVFKLPDVGEGVAEAEIVAWHVAVGDHVAEDAPLVDVMTDKATVEITSPVSGRVLSLAGAAGEVATVGAALVELEVGEDEPADSAGPLHQPADHAQRGGGGLAAPAVRARAKELGIELSTVKGTGPQGRVTHHDLDALAGSVSRPTPAAARPAPSSDQIEEIKVIGLRRRIADKMSEAKRRIPHFGYVEEIDVTELEELRQHLNGTNAPPRPRLTVLPFLMRAVVRAVRDFPQVNARYDDEAGIVARHGAVHIGIATQTEAGLMVPVVRHAETLDLWGLASEVGRLAAGARDGSAAREELSGSTITITSLGPLGGVSHFPVINHPEVAILGPNKIADRPVVRHGQVVVRKMMNVSSAFDHRVVDGYDAAAFIQRIKGLLEHPGALFID